MTPEEQRIAIAEACGWYRSEAYRINAETGRREYYWRREGFRGTSDLRRQERTHLPRYESDLNAMHEAEKTLGEPGSAVSYITHLEEVVGCDMTVSEWPCIAATAAQRAEAFLRTIGKWKEDAR